VGSGEGALPPPQQINTTFAEINVYKSKKTRKYQYCVFPMSTANLHNLSIYSLLNFQQLGVLIGNA